MPQIRFTNDQKAQLIGWLNREKDHLLSMNSMADRIIIPRVTGALSCIKGDLDFVTRLRSALRGSNESTELSVQDSESLMAVAQANEYDDRIDFWKSIERVLSE